MPVAPKAILYARFSPRPNAAECDSCQKQLADLREFCARMGWQIAGEFSDEDESGEDRERKGLAAALAACRRGFVLLVTNWDRLARDTLFNLFVFEDLKKRGCTLYSATQGPFGTDDPTVELLSTIFAAFAKFQRVQAAQRTRRRMRQHMAAGRNMSGEPPYGWEIDPDSVTVSNKGKPKRNFRPCAAEQAVVTRILEMHRAGESARAIARRLNEERIPCRRSQWAHKRVLAILKRAT